MRAIYLDNKIKGAIKQLINYFKEGVFDRSNTKVIFKYYKESYLFYKKELEKNNISYQCFFSINRLDMSPYKVVFYLFNAQSNCRILTFRNAKHIFVTHGESNKLASIKPIIRIYDYIVCAGDIGVDRYLENNIFTNYDVQTHRIIKMGNTFIGDNIYKKTPIKQDSYILYAPTWEGGVISEQYSSLSEDLHAFKTICNFAKENNIKNIVIQPHPNTGHRDKRYKKYLKDGIRFLKKNYLNVDLISTNSNNSLMRRLFLQKHKDTYPIYRAFVDVSAMEIQLLDKDIPTNIFINDTKNAMVKNNILQDYYNTICIKNGSLECKTFLDISEVKNLYLSYSFLELKDKTKGQRVDWLVDFVIKDKGEKNARVAI